MPLCKVSYGTARIQKLRRVSLDQNLLETLGLGVGDLVRIELDIERETVLISRVQETHFLQKVTKPEVRRPRAKG